MAILKLLRWVVCIRNPPYCREVWRLLTFVCSINIYSEEIFDFSAEQMTQQKTNSLKNQMCGEFSEIYTLCKEVLDRATKTSLIKATLQTLLRFLNWIPLGFIFETDLIDTLTNRVSQYLLVLDSVVNTYT